jgi:DNA-binding NarL/FixJ family response regulator
MTPFRILVVDDHSLFRRGLVSVLAEIPDFQVVGEASNGSEAILAAGLYAPELILMDVHMPVMGGVETVRALRKAKFPGVILMLTISQNEKDLLDALGAGADGYLLKNLEPQDIDRALRQARKGMGALSPEMAQPLIQAIRAGPPPSAVDPLTARELEVLGEIAKGGTTVQIAESLVISEPTVKTHVKNILKKLGAANRAEAVYIANQLGLVSIQKNHPFG